MKRTDLDKARTVVGTCPDMCPEKERYMRETRSQLSIFEVIPGTDQVQPGSPPGHVCRPLSSWRRGVRGGAAGSFPICVRAGARSGSSLSRVWRVCCEACAPVSRRRLGCTRRRVRSSGQHMLTFLFSTLLFIFFTLEIMF